ncbi:MAG: transcriptional repressor [Christensenellaceae bacterium]|nr:transcriptional repressor [Christensenellaceae bacterium]
MDVVKNSMDHPTTDMIYTRVSEILPNISMGTVYRNLAQLVAANEIMQIGMPSGADRYDWRIESHAHFVCTDCNTVIDIANINIDDIKRINPGVKDCDIDTVNLVAYGKCPKCKQAKA